MLRVAIPNKGTLSEPARAMLRESGYYAASNSRELVVHDPDNDADFFFLRPRDIATYVGEGTLDVGSHASGAAAQSHRPERAGVVLGLHRTEVPHDFGRLGRCRGRTGRRLDQLARQMQSEDVVRAGSVCRQARGDGRAATSSRR